MSCKKNFSQITVRNISTDQPHLWFIDDVHLFTLFLPFRCADLNNLYIRSWKTIRTQTPQKLNNYNAQLKTLIHRIPQQNSMDFQQDLKESVAEQMKLNTSLHYKKNQIKNALSTQNLWLCQLSSCMSQSKFYWIMILLNTAILFAVQLHAWGHHSLAFKFHATINENHRALK